MGFAGWILFLETAADDQFDDLFHIHAFYVVDGSDEFTIAEYGATVADSFNLLHAMRNIDKGDSFFLHAQDDFKQIVNFVIGKGRCRLIQNNDLRVL